MRNCVIISFTACRANSSTITAILHGEISSSFSPSVNKHRTSLRNRKCVSSSHRARLWQKHVFIFALSLIPFTLLMAMCQQSFFLSPQPENPKEEWEAKFACNAIIYYKAPAMTSHFDRVCGWIWWRAENGKIDFKITQHIVKLLNTINTYHDEQAGAMSLSITTDIPAMDEPPPPKAETNFRPYCSAQPKRYLHVIKNLNKKLSGTILALTINH